jgi:integrase/recombinase XerC
MLNEFRTHLIARHRSPNTIRIRTVYVRQVAERYELSTVTTGNLEAILVSHPEWKPETVNAAVTSWRVFFAWAERAGFIPSNPAADLERISVPRIVKVLADDASIKDALERATPKQKAILLLGREGGLRRAEIASLRIGDRSGRWLTVTGKGQKVRRLHISLPLQEALERIERPDVSFFYFPGGHDGHMAPQTVYNIVVRLTGTPTHALRRRALTNLFRNSGSNLRLTQEFAGHSDPSVTAIYINVDDDDMIAAGDFTALAA